MLMKMMMMMMLYLYEAAVPQPGVDLEDSLTREAVERTLEQNAASRPQQTVLQEKLRFKETNVHSPPLFV